MSHVLVHNLVNLLHGLELWGVFERYSSVFFYCSMRFKMVVQYCCGINMLTCSGYCSRQCQPFASVLLRVSRAVEPWTEVIRTVQQ